MEGGEEVEGEVGEGVGEGAGAGMFCCLGERWDEMG